MMEAAQESRIVSLGVAVDIETRRKKQQDLMIRMVERKVRERAQQLYEERGQGEGQALADWVRAETEILEGTSAAPLYRRRKSTVPAHQRDEAGELSPELVLESEAACQEPV
jgi:hypothetical protein